MEQINLTSVVTWLISFGGFGTLLAFTKKRFDRIEQKQDEQERRYYQCQAELPKTYANKKDTKVLFERTEKLEKGVSFLQGVQQGASGVEGGGV